MHKIRGLILDMDGVLWRGDQPIGDLPAIFGQIRKQGWSVVLATNNSTRTIEQYLGKLESFGVSLKPQQVITSAVATAEYLIRLHPDGGAVYVVGESGLEQTLNQYGFSNMGKGVKAVVAGLDRRVTYAKLKRASLLIRKGIPFIGTNPDFTLPSPEGELPGAGSLLAALETASGVKPTIIGKPNGEMFRQALDRLGTSPSETIVIGDRYETDIQGGLGVGCFTGLVLTGVAQEEDVDQWGTPPNIIASDLNQLLAKLKVVPTMNL